MTIAIVAALFQVFVVAGAWVAAAAVWRKQAGFAAALRACAGSGIVAVVVVVAVGLLSRLIASAAHITVQSQLAAFPGYAVVAGSVAAVSLLGHALFGVHRPRFFGAGLTGDGPLARWSACLCAIAGLSILTCYLAESRRWDAASLPIDFAVTLPVVCWLLLLWFVSSPFPPVGAATPEEKRAEQTEAMAVNLEARLREAQLLNGPVLFESGARAHVAADSSLGPIWRAAGGVGDAPAALRAVVDAPVGAAILVGDLPDVTEEALAVAAALRWVLTGGRVLMVCDEPEKRRGILRTALKSRRVWPAGPLVAGGVELEATLQEHVTPAAVLVACDDLDSLLLPLLASGLGRAFCDSVSLVILSRPDERTAISGTDLYFSMRRLWLLLQNRIGLPGVLATGDATATSRRFVEELTGRAVRLIPLGLRESCAVKVFAAAPTAGKAQILSALRKAVGACGAHDVKVEDPSGQLALADISPSQDSAAVLRRASFSGEVSLAVVDESWITRLYRSVSMRLPLRPGQTHVSLWWTPSTPLARFLLRPGMLKVLEDRQELATPRPLLGRQNQWLIRAHLEAALRESPKSEATLREVFGDTAVTERLANDDLTELGALARVKENGAIERSRLLRGPDVSPRREGRRTTVTRDVVLVQDEQSGAILGAVDRPLLMTRYYPCRVFSNGTDRFRVPAEAYADGPPRTHLKVRPVGESAALTTPLLEMQPECDGGSVDPMMVTRGNLSVALGSCDISVTETVRQVTDTQLAVFSFTPVTARYRSRAAVVYLPAASAEALFHLARVVDGLLVAHLCAAQEDIEVIDRVDGFAGVLRPALVFVDRQRGGMGVAEAIDQETVHELLRWARAQLSTCPSMKCLSGCEVCTPAEVMRAGPDKQGVLRALGAATGEGVAKMG